MGTTVTIEVEYSADGLRQAAEIIQGMTDAFMTGVPFAADHPNAAPGLQEVPPPPGENADSTPPPPSNTKQETPSPPGNNEDSTPPPPGGNAEAPELDSSGTPWLASVHSSGKTLNKSSGKWNKKRGISEAVLEAAEAEAREKLGAVATEETPASTETASTESTGDANASSDGDKIDTFPKLMVAISGDQFTPKMIAETCEAFDLKAIVELKNQPELIPGFAKAMGL